MILKLNISKKGLSTTEEVINEEYTLRYGHIFKGEKGDKGADGKDGERGADGKSAYQQAVEAGYKGSEEDFKKLLLSYPNKADKNGYYPNMSVGIADDVKNGNTKYLAATPSGDPMHYTYEAAGAVWNASTGYWSYLPNYGGLTDITTEQMKTIFAESWLYTGDTSRGMWFAMEGRININKCRWVSTINIESYCRWSSYVEVFVLREATNEIYASALSSSFTNCPNLKRIVGNVNVASVANMNGSFVSLPKLEEVRLKGLKCNVSFSSSPNLSSESILYMIENANATTAITITLHDDAYMRAQESDDIIQALDRKEKVSIASA